jgi:protocatechuate 3,4-dioxygenase beta subunit
MSLVITLSLAVALTQSPSTVTTATLAGQVLESSSRSPIARAQVMLIRVDVRARPFDQTTIVITDGFGLYSFEGLAPGRYQVDVRKPGFALLIGAVPQVTLAAGEQRTGLDVLLHKGAVIAGRVVDENGGPLAQMDVLALRRTPFLRDSPPLRRGSLMPVGMGDQTNDLGEFRLFGLPPGEYYVQARNQGGLSERFSGAIGTTMLPTYFPGTPEAVNAVPITVAEGETTAPVEIRIITVPAFEVSGVVVDEAGQPVANVRVSLGPDDATQPRGPMMGGWHGTRTDTAGRFTLRSVTSGHYLLVATAPVVIAVSPNPVAGGSVSGMVSSGGITTETANGMTVEWREANGTRVPVTISQANVTGLEVSVRRPMR